MLDIFIDILYIRSNIVKFFTRRVSLNVLQIGGKQNGWSKVCG